MNFLLVALCVLVRTYQVLRGCRLLFLQSEFFKEIYTDNAAPKISGPT